MQCYNMKAYNKQRSPGSSPITGPINYLSFSDYHKQKLIGLSVQTEDEPTLSLSQLSKLSPLLMANHGIIIERCQKNRMKGRANKEEIKEKIKDRIKAEIQSLIKKNAFKIKKVEMQPHSTKHEQSVSIIGSSALKNSVFTSDKNVKKIEDTVATQCRTGTRRQKTSNSSIRKSIGLIERANYSRKTRSNLENPRPGTVFTNQRINQKQHCRDSGLSNDCLVMHRRSMSNDIRVKCLMMKRKSSQFQFKKKQGVKEDLLSPWMISSFVDNNQQQF